MTDAAILEEEAMIARICMVFVFGAIAICAPTAHAEIYKVFFDVFTYNDLDQDPPVTLRCEIGIADTEIAWSPDAIDWNRPFRVTVPTETPKTFSVSKNLWEEEGAAFFPVKNPSSFGGKIPSGEYRLVLTDLSGRTFRSADVLPPNPVLPAARITQAPTRANGKTLKWTTVKGAQYYRIRLKEPPYESVFYFPAEKDIYIPSGESPSITFPPGALLRGMAYQIQVEARDNDKNLAKRSRSKWVKFVH